MTQIGTGIRIALTLGILQLGACASTAATNRVDELGRDGGGGASGSGGRGTGGEMWLECPFRSLSCRDGVVYYLGPGHVPPGMSCKPPPVSTCPYGCNPDWQSTCGDCNPDWQSSDPFGFLCNPRPPGCDDAGHCDGGRADSGVSDAGKADSGQTDSGAPDAARD